MFEGIPSKSSRQAPSERSRKCFSSPFSQGMRLDDPLLVKTLSALFPELKVQKLEEDWNGYHTSDVQGNIHVGSP